MMKLIKHFLIQHNSRMCYACNYASGTTPSKLTRNIKKVTCKNCIHLLKTLNKIKGKQ